MAIQTISKQAWIFSFNTTAVENQLNSMGITFTKTTSPLSSISIYQIFVDDVTLQTIINSIYSSAYISRDYLPLSVDIATQEYALQTGLTFKILNPNQTVTNDTVLVPAGTVFYLFQIVWHNNSANPQTFITSIDGQQIDKRTIAGNTSVTNNFNSKLRAITSIKVDRVVGTDWTADLDYFNPTKLY